MAVFNVLTLLGVASGTWQETILGLSVIVFGIAAQKRSAGVLK
jgi:ribose transport system permease protein